MNKDEIEQKLNLLNDKLIEEEKRIAFTINKVKNDAEKLIKDKEIEDYIIDLEVCGFKNVEDDDGYFFCSKTNSLIFFIDDYGNYKQNDFTEWGHNLVNEYNWNNSHCFTFHDLYDHKRLSQNELLEITEIWIEVKIRYQFISKY